MLFRRACLIVVFAALSAISHAQFIETANQFVATRVAPSTGQLTVYDVEPTTHKARYALTFPDKSFLSLSVNGRWYTNNDVLGQYLVGATLGATGTSVTPMLLDNGVTTMLADTIRTIFTEGGGAFDIVQDVYPVAFRASGQIVLRVKIINHTTAPLSVEGLQWLNDLLAVSHNSGNDNPYLIERNYYDGQKWRVPPIDGSSQNAPSFYVELEKDPTSLQLGTIGAGFTNDSFPPSPMGLTPCSAFAAVGWQGGSPGYQALDYIYGCPPPPSPNIAMDMACVLQWPPKNVPAARPNADTTIEEFRTSFGTQEFCMCLGNAISFNVFPTELKYNFATQRYSPNPFPALSMVFNTQASAISNVNISHSVSGPLQITSGGTIASGGQSASYKGATIKAGEMHDFMWIDSVTTGTSATSYFGADFNITATGLSGSWNCTQPGNQNGSCDIKIDRGIPFAAYPVAQIISRSGSYDHSVCNSRVTQIRTFDTGANRSTISVQSDSTLNMRVTIPVIKKAADTIEYTVQVIDSMFDGFASVAISDTFGNVMHDTVRYCTIPDILPADSSGDVFSSSGYIISDSKPWDRGIDSIFLIGGNNLHTIPALPVALQCIDSFSVKVIRDSLWSGVWLGILDCAGNRDTFGFTIISDVGVKTTELSPARIYPNPVTDNFIIELPDATPCIATILDLLGRTAASFTVRGTAHVDLSSLPPGTYILRVANDVRRIIKQ